MIRMLKAFLVEQAELRRKNRLLEAWIIKHMKKVFKYIWSNLIIAIHRIFATRYVNLCTCE